MSEMKEEKEKIRQAVSLTELVSQYTVVSRNKAKCLFHSDKTPSLSISESKGLWHCFGCGAGGDCFTFLMLVEGISFREALKCLAQKVGILLPEISEDSIDAHQMEVTQKLERLRALEEEKKQRKRLLDESSEFLGGLWKRVHASDWEEKEDVLRASEDCFVSIDAQYEAIEKWYEAERGKIYGQK